MDIKQARLETPVGLRQAYFGAQNRSGMEEDVNFRTLFLRNLHPTVSHHLGVLACPRSMSTQQLRDLTHKAYTKQKTLSVKTVKDTTICPVSEHYPELTLEGAQPHHSHRPFDRGSRPFQASRGQHYHDGAHPRHQSECSERFWEANQRPRTSRAPSTRSSSPDSPERNPSRHATGKHKSEHTSDENSAATSETAEILKLLKELLHKRLSKKKTKGTSPTSYA